MKIYQVQVIDIWNNITLIGFFKNLDDAIEPINEMISADEFKLVPGDLKEYPSTFSMVFDTTVGDIFESKHSDVTDVDYDSDDFVLQIRGFILDSNKILKEINTLVEVPNEN